MKKLVLILLLLFIGSINVKCINYSELKKVVVKELPPATIETQNKIYVLNDSEYITTKEVTNNQTKYKWTMLIHDKCEDGSLLAYAGEPIIKTKVVEDKSWKYLAFYVVICNFILLFIVVVKKYIEKCRKLYSEIKH